MFRPVSADLDFVAVEEAELARWKVHDVFARSTAQRAGAPAWIFYEGPPTANGLPGLHHVWARVYKDLFCRYQTMRGRFVDRRAGWDTHGLPVEVQVERQLGISGKHQIEDEVGIAEFTRLCRESVLTHVEEFERLTERIGYWTDMERAYYTFHPSYVESVWWHLQQLFDRGLLYEDLKVVPYCPRCGTALSSHELGQPDVYGDEPDESCYARLEITDASAHGGLAGATHLVVWTTTPWTLLSNVAVAVNPEVTYAVVDGHVVRRVPGRVGLRRRDRRERHDARHGAAGRPLPAPLRRRRPTRGRRRLLRRGRRVRDDRGRHWSGPPGAGLRRGRPPDRPRARAAHRQSGRARRRVHRRDRLAGGPGRALGQRGDQRRARAARPARAPDGLRALPAALLALRHRPHLLGQAQLVRRDESAQGPDDRRERDRRLAPGAHPRRALRRMAGQQRRLGPVARPLLGHAAADLAL